ncbi:PEP-CTERM sorting domain-containing protein [Phragmitibacter flavus]|uniref:PEP-CTERM sorting domain-containing protein n=1 Tax=Phragmitibacter flavus TaxID=2576071 RepID=A0A5R8K9D6_9BACT|nr:PEP-CTERM sorting domain-containing protein [Phragmitibacter flavus]TLD68928.1 PEP-CTERM sorting domain-containing protein [Phragmitibacter flavus]
MPNPPFHENSSTFRILAGISSTEKITRSGKTLSLFSALAIVTMGWMGTAQGATVLYFQGFEDVAPTNAWNYAIGNSTVTQVGTLATSGQVPLDQGVLAGDKSLQHSNRVNGTGVLGTVTFSSVDLTQFSGLYTGLYIEVRLSSTGTSANGNDTGDYFRMFSSINGAAFETDSAANADISLAGRSNARWGFNAAPLSPNPPATVAAGGNLQLQSPPVGGGTNDNNYSTFRINLDDSASSIALRLNFLNDSSGEFWNVDNVAIYGTLVPEPSKMVLVVFGLTAACIHRRRSKTC